MPAKTSCSHLRSLTTVIGMFLAIASAAPGARADVFNIYISSTSNNTVYEVPSDFGGTTVGAGQIFGSGYTGNYGIASLNGDVYVAQNNGQIYRKSSSAGGTGTGSLFTTASATIFDIDFADSNNLQAVGTSNTVQVFNSSGVSLGSYTLNNSSGAAGIDYAPGDGVYVSYLSNPSKIERLTGSGTSYSDATPAGLAATNYTAFLQQIVKGPNGMLYAASFQTFSNVNEAIYEVNPTSGAAIDLFPGGTVTVGATIYNIRPTGVDIGPDGLLYFTDDQNNFLFRSALDGSNPEIVAKGFNFPVAITFIAPEPGSVGLLGVGAASLLARRRRQR